jgi:polar amino acid transport system substrate-binding protein
MNRSALRARLVGLSCVAFLAAGLSACSSSGGGSNSPADAGATSPQAAKSLVSALPATIAKSGTLVVGIESAGASSMEYTSGSTIVGFDPDLIKAIGNELGVKVVVEPASFDSLVAGVQSGRYDVAISEMADTKAREQSVSFVDYLNIGVAVTVKEGNPAHIQGADDLCGQSVAVATGGYPQTTLIPALSAQCLRAGKPAVRPLSFTDSSSLALAVQSGRADCSYGDAAGTAYLLRTTSNEFQQAGQSQILARAGIAFPKTDTQLGVAIESALRAVMKSGEYAAIAKTWDLTGNMITAPSINDALI